MKQLYMVVLLIWFQKSGAQNLYFPPITGNQWTTVTPSELGWCDQEIQPMYDYLEATHTKGFMVLKDGKIVLEKYFGSFNQDSVWYWASAGKSLTAFVIGVAQQKGLLSIEDKVSKYLGEGWTSCTRDQEDKIRIRHLLTMTSGLDDQVPDLFCNAPECLKYKADAGTRWAYHTGVYSLLLDIVEKITGKNINNFLNQNIAWQIGMKGLWTSSSYGELYFTNIRSMARYGLLILNKGVWDGKDLMKDSEYFNAMINTSQQLNPSYGYLWWLNGKSGYLLPSLQITFPGSVIPNAPDDMVCALGKNGQIICVIPSLNIVMLRMGDNPDGADGMITPTYLRNIFGYFNLVACNTSSSRQSLRPSEITIRPNPAHNYLTWSIPDETVYHQVDITDIHGKVHLSRQKTSGTLDISNLSNGVYFLVLKDKNGTILGSRRFLKL